MRLINMDPKRLAILQLMSQDSAYENHFFKTKKNPIWFLELKKRGYFDPKKNPTIQPADKEGYYVIPQWNVLEYLERIAEQVNIPENEKYIDELLEIIKNVSRYKDDKGNVIDNYRTWWFFIKILLKLPNEKIPMEILDLVPIWLRSQYGGSLVDADAATKLLPKFLYEGAPPDDIKKAESLINSLTDFIWIQKKGIFTEKEDEAHGVVEDHWLIESFIEKGNAKLMGKLCDKQVIYNIAEKLKLILNHKQNSRLNIDYEGQTYRLSAKTEKDFEYVCQIGTYKKKTKLGEEDFRDDYSIDIKELVSFTIKAKKSEEFMKQLAELIENTDIPSEVKEKMKANLGDLYRYIYHDYSYIWFKDLIFLPPSRKLHDFKHILVYILAESLFELQSKDPAKAEEIANTFLSENFQHQVFKRLVVALIAKNWTNYKDIFWSKLLKDKEFPLLEDPAFENEMRFLLKENVKNFSEDKKTEIDKLISQGPQKYIIEENKGKYIQYWQQRWYGVLKEDPFFVAKYSALRTASTYDDEKEEREGEFGWVGPGPSPLTEEEILQIPNLELAKTISDFKERDILGKGPSAEGFAKAIESAVKKNPGKFAEDMDPFLNAGFYYVDYILDGFKAAWASRLSFDWIKVLNFIQQYIDRPIFWKNKLTVKAGFYDADNKWIIGSFGELIQEGTKDDEWSIPTDAFPIAKKIFFLIANKTAKDKKDSNNFPGHVLNCGLGKVNIGLLYLTLRIARLQKEDEKVEWDKELKDIFDTFLDRNIYDAYTVLGENLISYAYLDKEWATQQIKSIAETKDKVLWDAFMSGYLAASRVNLDLYKLMRANYIKALTFNFEESILNERLIDHIGIGYLNGVETIDGGGLLQIIWGKWDPKQIMALSGYFWSQRDSLTEKKGETELDKEMRKRIIQFWRDVYNKVKDKKELSKEDKDILSEITKLIIFLPSIEDESYRWLMLSAPYVQEHFNSPYLLECLNKFKDKGEKIATAKRIANIFLEMLKSFKPDYDQEDIRSLVDFLYQANDAEVKKLANSICDQYAKSEIEIVTDIYKKYNS